MDNLYNFDEFKAMIRGVLVATVHSLTVDELWERIVFVLGEEEALNLKIHFGFHTPFDLFMSIPHVVQIEHPENRNSAAVALVSSEQIVHIERFVLKDILRVNISKKTKAINKLFIPYRIQCAFIRIFVELYPEGMKIDDFISDILRMHIFKPLINHVEELILHLNHIFETSNLEVIYLQPTIVNGLREIKEKDKFSASYISSFDQNSFKDKSFKQMLDYGLEYPLYNILQNQLKNNIEQLLCDETIGWISETEICSLFNEKFGFKFTQYRQWGFKKVRHMFSKLPEMCCICIINNDTKIISIKKNHICDVHSMIDSEKKEIDYELPSIAVPDISEKKFDSELLNILKNDPNFQAPLNDCFMNGEIQHFELQINESYDINVCSAYIRDIPTIVCQRFDKSDELMNLLVIMNTFYSTNQSKFVCNSAAILVNQIYAFCLDALWFRGIVINNNANLIKIFNIDNGMVSEINHNDIRILHKQFSQLPAQTFTCHLNGIKSVDEDQFLKILDKKCTVYVVAIDPHNKYASVGIKLMGSKSNEYLNDEWLKNGTAIQFSSDEECLESGSAEIYS